MTRCRSFGGEERKIDHPERDGDLEIGDVGLNRQVTPADQDR